MEHLLPIKKEEGLHHLLLGAGKAVVDFTKEKLLLMDNTKRSSTMVQRLFLDPVGKSLYIFIKFK